MDYDAELDNHKLHSFLRRMRMGWRREVISRVPEFMVGTSILFWQVDFLIYRIESAIEHKIWTRRLFEYREKLKTLSDQSYRKCREGKARSFRFKDWADYEVGQV